MPSSGSNQHEPAHRQPRPHEQPQHGLYERDHGQAPATVVIPRRFIGPPDSANGGYACGTTARLLGDAAAEVTLRRPPPVDRALRVERTHDRVALYDGEHPVVEARPARTAVDVPEAVSLDAAMQAADRFDVAGYAAGHPFPTCFTCGPARKARDGLRIFPAPAGDGRPMVLWPWAPDASFADDSGLIDLPIIWAALDCPSGFARFNAVDVAAPDAVLGRMTATVHRRPEAGDMLVVGAWAISDQGKKLQCGSALWSATGELLAENLAVWIVLSEEQRRTFRVADGPQ